MKVYHHINEFKSTKSSVVTIGTFDGVHAGHQVIINKLITTAKKINAHPCQFGQGESVILTFFPHPRMVLYPDNHELRLLNTISERVEMLAKTGIDHLIIHPFSVEFSQLSAAEFVRDILVKQLNVFKLIIGYDHHFGKDREGSFEQLHKLAPLYGFHIDEIPAQEIQQIKISSTKIRHSLRCGEINAANQFLGYHYFIKGKVVKGNKMGRELGFPTANLKIDEWYKLIPANGVYAVRVKINEYWYNGMLNIGSRPTINGTDETIEVNIFNFDEDIYNKDIIIEFYERIRDEQKFNQLSDLKNQLQIDKNNALQILI